MLFAACARIVPAVLMMNLVCHDVPLLVMVKT
jgi:hypothetical protein